MADIEVPFEFSGLLYIDARYNFKQALEKLHITLQSRRNQRLITHILCHGPMDDAIRHFDVVTRRQSAMSSLRANATIIVLRVLPRPSAVRV